MKRKTNWHTIIFWVILVSLAASAVFVTIRLIASPADPNAAQPYEKVKSDYALMLLQCLLGIAAMFLPGLLSKRWRLHIPSRMIMLYVLFLYAAIYLGEVRSFYYKIANWDTILHTCSGAMLGALGFSIITLLNKSDKIPMNMSAVFVCLFAFCFAIMLGVVWEIYEYTMDGLMGLNMQKFMLEDGTQLLGRAALRDTMKDLIVDLLGALVSVAIGFVSLRKNNVGWLETLQIRKEE